MAQDTDLPCIIAYELPVSRAMAGGKRFLNLTRPRVLFILTQDTVRQTISQEGSRNHRLSLLWKLLWLLSRVVNDDKGECAGC